MTGEGAARYVAREWLLQTAVPVGVHEENPDPVVVHPEGYEYRKRTAQALNAANRTLRCSPGISGLQIADPEGQAVSVLAKRTLLEGMKSLSEKDGFPIFAHIPLGLCFRHPPPIRRGRSPGLSHGLRPGRGWRV